MPKRLNIKPGDTYHDWTIVRELETKKRHRMFLCICKCGTRKPVSLVSLNHGNSKMCRACSFIERDDAWSTDDERYLALRHYGMIRRCHDPTATGYEHYGGRGIAVCKQWQGLAGKRRFVRWSIDNGYRKGLQLDRIDNNRGYSPGNCRFVTAANNSRNRRNSRLWHVNGNVYETCTDAARALGVSHTSILQWCKSDTRSDCWSEPKYEQ